MDIQSIDLAKLFFKKRIDADMKNISLDADMLRILVAIEEHKSMSQVAHELKMNPLVLRQKLAAMIPSGLLTPIDRSGVFINEQTMKELKAALVRLVGPMGEIILDDVLGAMGLPDGMVPPARAQELVDKLTQEIPDEGMRRSFQGSATVVLGKAGVK